MAISDEKAFTAPSFKPPSKPSISNMITMISTQFMISIMNDWFLLGNIVPVNIHIETRAVPEYSVVFVYYVIYSKGDFGTLPHLNYGFTWLLKSAVNCIVYICNRERHL